MLTSVGGRISLDDLAINSLNFLNKVTSVNSLLLRDLPMLNNVQGLDDLTSLSSFNLTNCDLVTNLEGFPSLSVSSLSTFNIASNSALTTLSNSFIESLTSVESFSISFNENLIEVDGLQNIISLTDTNTVTSTIRDNDNLQSINMYALRNVSVNLNIYNQSSGITNLCGLYDYVTIGDGATTLTFQGTNPTNWDSVQDILDNCNAALSAKVYLQGAALNPNSGEESLMRDDLRIIIYYLQQSLILMD